MVMVVCLHMYMLYTHELLIPCSISLVHNSLSYCCCPVTDPGVSYTVTVRASTAVGSGEPVSIIFFSVEQGKHKDKILSIEVMLQYFARLISKAAHKDLKLSISYDLLCC